MVLRSPFVLACGVVWAGQAAGGDADCLRARDQHADFRAILTPDPTAKPQFDTVKRGSDGIVTITRWIGGEKRSSRKAIHGIFSKVTESLYSGRTLEQAFSASINLANLFPLHANMTAEYRVAISRSDRFDPKFANARLMVGAQREVAIGGCRLQILDVTTEWQGTDPQAIRSKSTFAYAPALEYAVEFTSQVTLPSRTFNSSTKVQAIEAWSE